MQPWHEALRRGLVSGTAASVTSAATLAACGAIEDGHAAAPTNAISHWLWGDGATRANRPSVRHTLAGYAIHHAASIFWAVLYERYVADAARAPARIAADAALASATACFVDYQLTPQRLRPGFERRLSRGALLAVYAAFAAGLAISTLGRR